MRWFRRKPKPVPEYRTYGCAYNATRQRWELYHPDCGIPHLPLIQVWGPYADRQPDILSDYDDFQRMLRSKVGMAQ